MKTFLTVMLIIVTTLLYSCREGTKENTMSYSSKNATGHTLEPHSKDCTSKVSSIEQLREKLTIAQSNNQDDVICIQAGTYRVNQTLTYVTPNGDNGHKLTIRALGQVVLDGHSSLQIMRIITDSNNDGGDVNAHVTIEGVTFQNGRALDGGGLHIRTDSANITLTNNTFIRNENVHHKGGGAYLKSISGSVTIIKNTFSNNISIIVSGGAHAETDSGTINFTNNVFSGNIADLGGGASAYSKSGNIIIENNTFTGNSSGSISSGGGLLAMSHHGNVTLINNTISNNSAEAGGGAFASSEKGIVNLINNTFFNNIADVDGGGAYASSEKGTVNLINNTFYNNTVKRNGGGVFVSLRLDSATANIYNNIFWKNTANAGGNDGDDLYVKSDEDNNQISSTVNLYNNTFSGSADLKTGQSEDLYITLVQTGRYNQSYNVQADPLFVDASAGDFRLQANSPCINVGNNNAPELPQKDKDKNPRIVDGVADMGAYEF
ncbi:MAG: right-handed parallel beta-helix repeat-containing protein, partial [Aquificaceae bacterium]